MSYYTLANLEINKDQNLKLMSLLLMYEYMHQYNFLCLKISALQNVFKRKGQLQLCLCSFSLVEGILISSLI